MMRTGTCHVLIAVLCNFCGAGALAADLPQVRAELVGEIESARAALGAAEADISEERGELTRRLNTIQNRVLELRRQAVAARRAADEETLSLSRIQARLESWREQSQFQSRLLAGYLDRAGSRALAEAGDFNLEADLQVFSQLLRDQDTRLTPAWQNERLVMPDGQLTNGDVLRLGPVGFFFQDGTQRSGLANRDGELNRVAMLYDNDGHAGLDGLYRQGTGRVTFDPTLNRALLLAGDEESLLEHLQKGGIWVIPILSFALFATVIAAVKAVALYRLPALQPALAERVEVALREGPQAVKAIRAKVRGAQQELLGIALAAYSSEQRDDRLYAALLAQRNTLERWLGAIAMTASVSPLLGLLGTVSGMIATFKLMTLFGAGDASSVSAGISEALVTTELGLVVAIPALLAHALMSRKVKNYFAQLETDAVHLSRLQADGASS